jgi:hypothetical protein
LSAFKQALFDTGMASAIKAVVARSLPPRGCAEFATPTHHVGGNWHPRSFTHGHRLTRISAQGSRNDAQSGMPRTNLRPLPKNFDAAKYAKP